MEPYWFWTLDQNQTALRGDSSNYGSVFEKSTHFAFLADAYQLLDCDSFNLCA